MIADSKDADVPTVQSQTELRVLFKRAVARSNRMRLRLALADQPGLTDTAAQAKPGQVGKLVLLR